MSALLKIRHIETLKHKIREFTAMALYVIGKNNTGIYEIYLVKILKANLLIENNIMS